MCFTRPSQLSMPLATVRGLEECTDSEFARHRGGGRTGDMTAYLHASETLRAFRGYYVNKYADHHMHQIAF
jgi:hypothetical protein